MIEDRKEQGVHMSNVVHIEVPFGKPIQEVYDGVHDGPILGSGVSGLVRKITHKATGAEYAVKCLDLEQIETTAQLDQLKEEIVILCELDHPNIVRLEEVYESHSEIYLVQELCLGGELFDRLDEQPDYHYTEGECARLVKQMLSSVRYLHSKGILHRDLKLENFLFATERQSQLKMIDFGISKHFVTGEKLTEGVGTPYTVAPEVIRGHYDHKCDLWAIGVLTFLLLSGDAPFGGVGAPGENMTTVRDNILSGEFYFEPEDIWEAVTPSAKSFIKDLLVTDPTYRPHAEEAQKHAWLREWKQKKYGQEDPSATGNGADGSATNRTGSDLNPHVVESLLAFKEKSDLHKLLCEALSFTLLPDQIWDLRFEFEKMDTDGSGEISLNSLKEVLLGNAAAGSLGSLTEKEVEDIFYAMCLRSRTHSIKWHEFIAASLSQCKVDDRNLRLAFDRLDTDHKGFIDVDDMLDLLESDVPEEEDAMQAMWTDTLQELNSRSTRVTYHDFVLLMKGQSMEVSDPIPADDIVPSTDHEMKGETGHDAQGLLAGDMEIDNDKDNGGHDEGMKSGLGGAMRDPNESSTLLDPDDPIRCSSVRPAEKPVPEEREMSMADIAAAAMNDDLGIDGGIDAGLPPGWNDGPRFRGHRRVNSTDSYQGSVSKHRRSRSNSDADKDYASRRRSDIGGKALIADPRRAMMLTSHPDSIRMVVKDGVANNSSNNDNTINNFQNNNKSNNNTLNDSSSSLNAGHTNMLAANQNLYRAHRQMRHSILDAAKRFEERRHQKEVIATDGSTIPSSSIMTNDTTSNLVSAAAAATASLSGPTTDTVDASPLIASVPSQDTTTSVPPAGRVGLASPGLVMRHKRKEQPAMSDDVRAWINKNAEEQAALVEKANNRTGRSSFIDRLVKSEQGPRGHKRSSSDVMEIARSIHAHAGSELTYSDR